jgi:hypothetical protein
MRRTARSLCAPGWRSRALEDLVRRHQRWIYNLAIRNAVSPAGRRGRDAGNPDHATAAASLLVLVAVFGAVSGLVFVAISAALAMSATPAT